MFEVLVVSWLTSSMEISVPHGFEPWEGTRGQKGPQFATFGKISNVQKIKGTVRFAALLFAFLSPYTISSPSGTIKPREAPTGDPRLQLYGLDPVVLGGQ